MADNDQTNVPEVKKDEMTDEERKKIPEIIVKDVIFVMVILVGILIFVVFNAYLNIFQVPFLFLLFMAGCFGGVTNMSLKMKQGADEKVKKYRWGVMRMQVYLSTLTAGIFGLVIYALFVSDILSGSMFPTFKDLNIPFKDVDHFLTTIAPTTQIDATKAIVWAYIAGFSETWVPNLLSSKTPKNNTQGKNKNNSSNSNNENALADQR